MLDQELIGQKMQSHYDAVWKSGDAWEFESSDYEQARFAAQLAMLAGRRYGRTLKIGCGSGCFTRELTQIADRVVALDISMAAIERARTNMPPDRPGGVEFRVANIMEFDVKSEGPWDLIVLSETIYSLGWLYPFFDVALLATNLLEALEPTGRLLLANTYGAEKDWLMRPWLIDTYRDLFRNVGFRLESEQFFEGVKNDHTFRVLMSLFRDVRAR